MELILPLFLLMHTQKTRAFVTGASGFVGAHLVYTLLEKGYVVYGLLRSKKNLNAWSALAELYPNANKEDIIWIEGDLLFPEDWMGTLEKTDVVFHTAALVSFLPKDRQAMMETNIKGTANVVNACLVRGNKPLVYVSSVAALGRAEGQEEVTEETTWKDTDHNTHYAVSKYLAEQEVWRGIEEGLQAAIVCPGIILGPWGKNAGSGQIPALVNKKMPFYPVGENGFVGVRDVTGMMVSLYENRCYGHRFLCVTENTSYRAVLTDFAVGFGVSAPKFPLKGGLLQILLLLSRLAERFSIPFPFPSQGLKSTSLKTRYISVKKSLLTSFEYHPLKKTIKETVDSYNRLTARSV
jgi:nucleoside-diphosphate-sugar epimerase